MRTNKFRKKKKLQKKIMAPSRTTVEGQFSEGQLSEGQTAEGQLSCYPFGPERAVLVLLNQREVYRMGA
jgi:hypothetical protein